MGIDLHSTDVRSKNAIKNIIRMLCLKGGSILAGLLLVPMTINYVDSDTYGIWLTLSSMVTWLSFFDVGLNQGLRNRLTEAIANGDKQLGRTYVSTTYALLILLYFPLMLILLLIIPHIDWNSVLNVSSEDSNGLVISVAIIISYFCINFVLSTINIISLADQKPSETAFRTLIQQVCSIFVIYLFTKFTEGNLVLLCVGLCAAPVIISLIYNFVLFGGKYKEISPSLSYVDFRLLPNLLHLGVQFFIIQIAAIVQMQLFNFLIIRFFGPESVTQYNIANKYFGVMTMVWGIVITPLWSAVTDAVSNNDYKWIGDSLKNYLKLFLLVIVGAPIMLLLSQFVYRIWIGDMVQIDINLSFWVMSYNIVVMFGSIFVNILNGAGILKVQTISSLISPTVFLGVSYLLYTMGMGVPSILIAGIIANFNGFLLAPIQCVKLLRNK